MFFDRNNCRTFRLLNNISYILEAAINRLLELERETLREIENEKATQTCNNSHTESPNVVKVKTEPLDKVSANNNGPEVLDPDINVCRIRLIPEAKLKQEKRVKKRNVALNLESTGTCGKRKSEAYGEESPQIGETSSKLMKLSNESPSPELALVKKEASASELEKESGEMFSPETSSSVLNQLNKSSNNKGVNPESCNATVKREVNDDPLQSEDPFIGSLQVMNVPRNRMKYGSDLNQALIKFKQCFSHQAAKAVLADAGVHNIDDLAINEKQAVITFFNKEDWKVLMALSNRSGLKKIKATSIEPYTNAVSR